MLLLLLLFGISIAASQLGWRAGAWSKRAATLAGGCCCVFLVAGATVANHLSWLPERLLVPTAVYLQCGWFVPPGMLLILIAARQAHEKAPEKSRRVVFLYKLLASTILGIGTISLVDRLGYYTGVEQDLDAKPDIDADGVVRQSTGYSCGAAASATLLRRLGVDAGATERQLAPLCFTRRYSGATSLSIAVGLRCVAAEKGWHVRIINGGWETLCRLRKPVLVSVKDPDHAVVLCAIDAEKGVQIADPLTGLSWWTQDVFLRRFENEAIVIFRDEPWE